MEVMKDVMRENNLDYKHKRRILMLIVYKSVEGLSLGGGIPDGILDYRRQ